MTHCDNLANIVEVSYFDNKSSLCYTIFSFNKTESNMTKLSETENFKKLQSVVNEVCSSIAFHAYSDAQEHYVPSKELQKYVQVELSPEDKTHFVAKYVDDHVDTAFGAIELCFTDFDSITDTVTRDRAKSAILSSIHACFAQTMTMGQAMKFFDENIDCSEVFEDILHMNSGDDTEFEYEGDNKLFSEVS